MKINTTKRLAPYCRRISGSSESATRLACNPHEHTFTPQITRSASASWMITFKTGRGCGDVSEIPRALVIPIGMDVVPSDIAREFPVPHGTGQMVILGEEDRLRLLAIELRRS